MDQLGQSQLCVVRRDAKVAGQRHLESATEGEAVDRGDRRLRQRGELVDVTARTEPVTALRGRLGLTGLLEVHAGAEEAVTRGGEHDHRDLIVGRDARPEPLELVAHLLVPGVRRVGPIEGHRRDAVGHREGGGTEVVGPTAVAHDADPSSIFLPDSS